MDRKQALFILDEDIVELWLLCSRAEAVIDELESDFLLSDKPNPQEFVMGYPKIKAFIDIAHDYVFQAGSKLEKLCHEGE